MLVLPGPTIQHELALWVKSGIPATVALQAATYNAARALGLDSRIGLIKKGHDASLLVLDGDPVLDISSLEHISSVMLGGERINRSELLETEKP
jgi:imidazolonepropionase-like amidohydrolase